MRIKPQVIKLYTNLYLCTVVIRSYLILFALIIIKFEIITIRRIQYLLSLMRKRE